MCYVRPDPKNISQRHNCLLDLGQWICTCVTSPQKAEMLHLPIVLYLKKLKLPNSGPLLLDVLVMLPYTLDQQLKQYNRTWQIPDIQIYCYNMKPLMVALGFCISTASYQANLGSK